jgi:hypothetical protein
MIAFLNIFKDGSAFYFGHRNRRTVLDLLMVHSGEFQHVIEFVVDAEGERDALW